MAFLDNSGDIILDAVLTDTGRFRMARGDFRISKFALGDDEIDYSLFNKNHPSGSAYYDLEVLRTPLLEAFTNNTSTMKSKLISISRTNLLHLPILKLLNGGNSNRQNRPNVVLNSAVNSNTGGFIVTVDSTTQSSDNMDSPQSLNGKGIILGDEPESMNQLDSNSIIVERGLDTTKIPPGVNMDATLQETQFIIEMDHRLGSIVSATAESVPISFIDDDQIASYYVSENTINTNTPLVKGRGGNQPRVDALTISNTQDPALDPSIHNIRGPRDRLLHFKIMPSINLNSSTFLFEKLGSTINTTNSPMDGFKAAKEFYILDSIVRVTSATTGYAIDIPIRFVKKT